jgi:hypothetical protein
MMKPRMGALLLPVLVGLTAGCAKPPSQDESSQWIADWYCKSAGSGETIRVAHRGELKGFRFTCQDGRAPEKTGQDFPECDGSQDTVLWHQRSLQDDGLFLRVHSLKCGKGEATAGFEPYRKLGTTELVYQRDRESWKFASTREIP